jgi:hypothetical protein
MQRDADLVGVGLISKPNGQPPLRLSMQPDDTHVLPLQCAQGTGTPVCDSGGQLLGLAEALTRCPPQQSTLAS